MKINSLRPPRILVADDEPTNIMLVDAYLSRRGCEVNSARDAMQVTTMVRQWFPDLLLLDVCMPGRTGMEILQDIRSDPAIANLPVILVSGLNRTEDIVSGLNAGANDYVTKPIDFPVLLARIATQIKLATVVAQLEQQTAVLERLSAIDELTGVYNRRAFLGVLATEVRRARTLNRGLCLVFIDIDHFKNVNDTHGHAVGDSVLAQFTAEIMRCLRASDTIGRLGGEEFCVVLPSTTSQAGVQAAERMRERIEAAEWKVPTGTLRITGSFGVAYLDRFDESPDQLTTRADEALYAAKRGGRNRVELWLPVLAGSGPVKTIQDE